METYGWYWSRKCDSFYFVESRLSERASCPPRMRMLDDPFLNHLHLFDWELDLWWHSESPLYQPSPFASFCDLTQIMTWAPVSDKIWDVNTLYIAYTPIIIYSPHPCNYICIHIVVGYAWKCTEWLLTRTEENMWVRLNVLKLVHQAEIVFTIVHSVWQIVPFAWTDGWHQATRTSLAYDRRSVKRK